MKTRLTRFVAAAALTMLASLAWAQAHGARDLFLADANGKRAGAGPLGLRYSLLKKTADAEYAEVDADTVFGAGDAIRLSVELSRAAHLYIVQRGSTGRWSVLFASGDELAGGRRHEVPAGGEFGFDAHPGNEKLFIIVSRQPEPGLEKRDDLDRWLTQQQNSRDLVRQKVNDTSGDRIEKAVYIVNPNQSPESRLVVELNLKHR